MSSVEVSYTIEGKGDPLYMVHGIGSRRIIWNALIKELKHQFTCVSFDLRGHGESPVPPVPYSLDELVEDLEGLRAHLGHESIHIVGHSLGGQVDFISDCPEAVKMRIQQIIETPLEVFLSVFDIYSSTEMLPWLKHITCPCLVMTGEFDPGCNPRLNQLIVDALPNAELVILDNLKHSILVEAPDKVLPPLRDFLYNYQKF